MKKSTLSLAIGLLLACSTGMAKTQHLTLEQRMALLEELEAAEMRAAKAEGQVKQLQTQQAAENFAKLRLPGRCAGKWTDNGGICKEKCHLT
ncbi:hypothetical protein ACVXHB_20980 [Escherichia coli]